MEFDFSENTSVPSDSFETKVPQDFRGLYVEKEGNMVLGSDHEGVKSAVAAVTRINQALRAARGEVKDLKGKAVDLSTLSDYGTTPEEITAGVAKAIEEAKKAAGSKGGEELERQVTKIKADLSQAHAKELESRDERVKALTGQLHKLLVTNAAVTALTEAEAVDPDLVLPHIASQVKVEEKDGEFKVHVVDSAGDPRYSGATGVPMTIKELVTQMKGEEKYGPLFKSDKPSGGGGPVTRRTTTAPKGQVLSPTQKIAAGLRAGQHKRS